MADLKDEILSKIDQRYNKFLEFLSELKYQIKKEVSEAIKTEIKKREELELTVSLLQEQVFWKVKMRNYRCTVGGCV